MHIDSKPKHPVLIVRLKREDKIIFLLRSTSCSDLEDGYYCLKLNIQNRKGYVIPRYLYPTDYPFGNKRQISFENFLKNARTGDIMLFRGSNLGARLQRKITRSEYDHVGMLLRYNDGNIALLEATSREGVDIVYMDEFLRLGGHL